MNVRFLSVDDVKNSRYMREGNKNLLLTDAGAADTIALCGVLTGAVSTKYGPNISIDDSTGSISITAGTFNKKLKKSAEKLTGKFKENKTGIYLLIYANPYQTDRLYLNANYDNSVLEVDKEVFAEFHEMRKKAGKHLMKKAGKAVKEDKEEVVKEIPEKRQESKSRGREISEKEIIELIEKSDRGKGVKIEDLPEIEDKIYELIEKGELYEPLAGRVRVV